MRKVNVLVGFALVLALLAGGIFAAEKVKTDKERITLLEMQVSILDQDLQGAHDWAMSVNSALQQLNGRLTAVESRGPVAKLQQ